MPPKEYTFPRPASTADSIQSKPRKPRKTMPRSAGVSDAEWRADVQRPEAVTTDRQRGLDAKRINDTEATVAAAAAMVDQEEVSRAGMMNPPGRNSQAAWRGLQGVAPATHSSTMSPWGYAHSPGYSDGDVHGGFNPNTTFSHGAPQCSSPTGFGHDPRTPSPAFSAGPNTQYNYSPLAYSSVASPAPSMCRGILPFAPTSSLQFNYADAADMDEIITSGSVATASHPEFGAQDETMDTIGDIEMSSTTPRRGGEDETLEVELEPGPQKKGRKRKREANAKPVEPRVKWGSKEDECLAEAWKTISIDPITSTNQNSVTY
ncbi:D-2-hydroxyglutarate dehydrogenase, mitochondrial [Hordeum vulgare]|nr:D-2-hydroxyglutarate dehydrogenase, mitochondrial [Hordeum vulgare]